MLFLATGRRRHAAVTERLAFIASHLAHRPNTSICCLVKRILSADMEKVPVGDVGPSFKRQPSKLPRGHISGRRAGFRCSSRSPWSHWPRPSTPGPIPSSTPSRRLPRRSTCSRRCPNRMFQLGNAELREPSGSGAALLVCASALCASWLSVLKYFALYRVHRGDAQK